MSEWQYIENLRLLEARGSKHPLMAILARGYSSVNVIYMKSAMESIPDEVPKVEKMEEPEDVDFDLKRLFQQKQTIFGQRAQLSNQMMKLPESDRYNAERAKYSDQIQKLQREIGVINLKIDLAEKGIASLPDQNEDIDLSEADLVRRLQSLRASRSRKRRQAETATGDDLKRIKEEIESFNQKIEHVERAIENKNI